MPQLAVPNWLLLTLAVLLLPARGEAAPLDDCHSGVILKVTNIGMVERCEYEASVWFRHRDGRVLQSVYYGTVSNSPRPVSKGCGVMHPGPGVLPGLALASWHAFAVTNAEILEGQFECAEGFRVDFIGFADERPSLTSMASIQGLERARVLFSDAQAWQSRSDGRRQAYNALNTIDNRCDDCDGPEGIALRAEIEEWISASRVAEALALMQQARFNFVDAVAYLQHAEGVLLSVPESDPRHAKAVELRTRIASRMEALTQARF